MSWGFGLNANNLDWRHNRETGKHIGESTIETVLKFVSQMVETG
jgi:hypothetical protein